VCHHSFVVYDDNDYVTENHVVQNGLTWAGVKWAFTTWQAGNWHPLTWLSHMLDCELFGLNPGAQHYVNVLFHAANTVLLFALFLQMTNLLWPSAFVAALFAWHPLHVESVAWVAERKDVLSTFFGLLALLSYTRFVEASRVQSPKSKAFYALALLMFAFSLMSKPMLVTLPFVMLLLDFWPLRRSSESKNAFSLSTLNPQLSTILEKWPFLLLAAISCVVTFQAQRHSEAVLTLQQFPLNLRIENALISCVRYLSKLFWPSGLAVLYPLPGHSSWMLTMAAAAAGLLGVVSWFVWWTRRPCPYLLVGWLWFLGTLVPVIGLVQVGSAAMADRYTYFPAVGVFVAVVFGMRDLANRFQFLKTAVAAVATLTIAACLILTENQLHYWGDSESLFAHTLAVTKDNPNALINYGVALEQQGQPAEALAWYREAARIAADNGEAHYNIGNALDVMGKPAEALPELLKAAELNPRWALPHNGLGIVFTELGHFDEAMSQFKEAGRLDPTFPWVYWEMGKSLLKQGRDAEAIGQFHEALRLDPNNFKILAYTARVLAADENPEIRDGKTAVALAAKANDLTGGTQPFVLDALGMACAETGDFTNAQAAVREALDLATAVKMKNLEPLRQRLQLYKNHQPWRESFLFTNAPAKN
jgi:tetratricopeptide (TPR) repeat protein